MNYEPGNTLLKIDNGLVTILTGRIFKVTTFVMFLTLSIFLF